MFAQVLENIQTLLAYEIPLTIAITPSTYMTDSADILRLAWQLGVPVRINSGLMPPRAETGRTKADADLDTYVQLLKLQYTLGGTTLPDPCETAPVAVPDAAANTEHSCGAGRSGFCITWDGMMRPCNTFPYIQENVLTLGFSEAWQRLHDRVVHFPKLAECATCRYSAVCPRCIAEHISAASIGHVSPPLCDRTKRLFAEGLIKA